MTTVEEFRKLLEEHGNDISICRYGFFDFHGNTSKVLLSLINDAPHSRITLEDFVDIQCGGTAIHPLHLELIASSEVIQICRALAELNPRTYENR